MLFWSVAKEELIFQSVIEEELVFKPLVAVDLEDYPDATKGLALVHATLSLSIGEPAGSVGNATITVMTFRSGGPTGGITGGERGTISKSVSSPGMSSEHFKFPPIVSEADKAMWEACVAKEDRWVKQLWGTIAWIRSRMRTNRDLGEIVLYLFRVDVL